MNNSIGVRDDCRISVFNLSSTIDIENIIRNKRKTCSVQEVISFNLPANFKN
jgi:hypothetical protein